jgi:hypothetical protein
MTGVRRHIGCQAGVRCWRGLGSRNTPARDRTSLQCDRTILQCLAVAAAKPRRSTKKSRRRAKESYRTLRLVCDFNGAARTGPRKQPTHMSSVRIETVPLSPSLRGSLGFSWPLLLGLTGFLLPIFLGWGLADGDTYLHISIGRWMLAHGQILTHDPFSFTRHGAPCTTQEWGSDLLIAAAFRVAGWPGLVALAALCFGASLAYLMRFLLARMEPLHALLLTLLAGLMMVPSLFARPHELVWPLTAIWVGTLIRSSEANRAPPWWLLGVLLLWVNMHGSFIIAPALAVLLALDSIIDAKEYRRRVAAQWLLFISGSLACMFVNPQGYRLLLFPFHLLRMKAALALIPEWQPPNFEQPQVLAIWIIAIVGLALNGRIRLSFVRSVLVLGLMFTALEHVRNVALLGLISPFLLARPVASMWAQRPSLGRNADGIDRWFRSLAAPARRATTWVMLAAAGVIAVVALDVTRPMPPAYARPRAALDTLLARAPGGRIFDDPAFGDYLIYRGVPDFMDDRMDLYGNGLLIQTARALSLSPGTDLEALLSNYRIDAILLGTGWPALTLLDRSPGWRRVYSDKIVVAYVRRGAAEP